MGLHRFAQLTAAMTFLLLIAGGLVTSTDSGLAVPDWPLSYGMWFPPMVGGILYEHSHRMIAAIVGVMIAIFAVWLRLKEPRRWVRWLGYGAFFAVVTQAVLGGLTVLWVLPTPISVAHACLGQLVFCLVVCLALVTSPAWHTSEPPLSDPWLQGLCFATTSLLFFQLLLGAMVRHSGRVLSLHLIGAFVAFGMVGWIVWRLMRQRPQHHPCRRFATMLLLGLTGQLALGVLTLFHLDHVAVTTAHVAVGALILASSCALTLMAFRPRGVDQVIRSRMIAQVVG